MEYLKWTEVAKKYKVVEEKQENIHNLLKDELRKSNIKLVVLDDDPTGVQAVHGISVYTRWDYDSILEGFLEEERMFFLLTNSRAMTEEQTIQVHKEIAANIIKASKASGKKFLIISRGDSTLRGHYPLETSVLKTEIEQQTGCKIHGEILIPYFHAGGRFTVDNIHYVKMGEDLIPAAMTEFAKDKTFGYTKSDLREYVEEKTRGKVLAQEVRTFTLEQFREEALDQLEKELCAMDSFEKGIVNAVSTYDLEVFCTMLYKALAKGKLYLLRTAADFVKVMGGISHKPLLTKSDMIPGELEHGGIVVIGSHTEKTTAQLNALKSVEGLVFMEFNSDLVLEDGLDSEVDRVCELSSRHIAEGRTVVVYTKRKLLVLEQDTKEEALLRSVKISQGVLQLVEKLGTTPSFVIAKGGITSSDIGVKALKVKKAHVLGQIQPGIPVWRTDEESLFPGIPYIIFPGNVGEDHSLRAVVEELMG